MSQLDNGTVTRQARNIRQCPEKETNKKQTLSQLDNGTVTIQARSSRHCPEKETNNKKKLESPRQWNGPQDKLETAVSAPKKRLIKNKP